MDYMKKILCIIALVYGGMLSAQNDIEKAPSTIGVAVGASASTNGLGVQAAVSVANFLALRVTYETIDQTFENAFQYSISDVPLNISPTWKTGGIGAMVDLYLQRDFYITGGFIQTNMDLSARMLPAESMQIGDIIWEPQDIGELQVNIRPLKKLAPYAGIGYGRNIARKSGISLNFELGAYFMDSYVLDVQGTKMFEGNSENESINRLNETLSTFDWSGIFPVVKIGISYRIL